MMSKRRLFCVIFTCMVILLLAACSGISKEELADYKQVQGNMKHVKDTKFHMKLKMDFKDHDSWDKTISAEIKQVGEPGNPTQMAMNSRISLHDTDINYSAYLKDRTVYTDTDGEKDKVEKYNSIDEVPSMDRLLDIEEDKISDLQMTKKGEDTTYIISFDADNAAEYFERYPSGYAELSDQIDEVAFSKMELIIVAGKDKMVKEYNMSCIITNEKKKDPFEASYTMTIKYNSINTGITIDFPDFNDHEEIPQLTDLN